jgi:hypothetical protein
LKLNFSIPLILKTFSFSHILIHAIAFSILIKFAIFLYICIFLY